jgi:hypothetical protein
MRTALRHSLLVIQLLTVGVLALTVGCDRQDNDWHMYRPELKAVQVPQDTIFLQEDAAEFSFEVTIGMVPDDSVFVFPVSRDSQVSWRPDSLIFAPVDDDWLRPRTLTVVVLPDQVDEGLHADELGFLLRSNDSDYDGLGGDLAIPVVITDNDFAGVALSETLLTLVESEAGAVYESYRLVLESRPTEAVTITMSVDPAEPSLHVDPLSVTFEPEEWDQPREISLWIELDSMDQDYQSLTIAHTSSSADTLYGPGLPIADLNMDIFDDTLPPTATIAAATADTMLESAVAGLDVVVTLSRPSAIPVTLHLATLAGTAESGDDFQPLDQDVTFQPGDPLERSFTLLPSDDTILEYTESFEVVITPVTGLVIGAADRVELYLADDDLAVLTLADAVANEDDGAAIFEVSCPSRPSSRWASPSSPPRGRRREDEDFEGVVQTFTLEPASPDA